jgi:hypothetical protein
MPDALEAQRAPDALEAQRAPDALDAEAAQEGFRAEAAPDWRDAEYDDLDDADDDDDDAVEDAPTPEANTEYVPALYNPEIEGYDPGLYEPPSADYAVTPAAMAAGVTANRERAPEELDFASELVRTRAVLMRLEQTVARDLTMLAEQIEAINHRISALEQDHDAIRGWIDGAPDDGTPDLRATRAQVRALNHRITAIERASK